MIKECENALKKGFSTEIMENSDNINCIAYPIFNNEKSMIATIAIAAPSATFPKEDFGLLAPELIEAAENISRQMGFS